MNLRHRRLVREGFTLIELLIVIGIISMLMQLTLPAVQMSREAARKLNCSNNLRQIGLASQLHHESQGYYPSGGWTPWWVGDPLRGFGRKQPGGWIYSSLPYVEAQAIYQLPNDGDADRITPKQKAAAAGMIKIPIPLFQCSSRRLPRAYIFWLDKLWKPINSDMTEKVARSDYAANGGDYFDSDPVYGSFEDGGFYVWLEYLSATRYSTFENKRQWSSTNDMNGVIFERSEVSAPQITDGLTSTYLIGEKYLNALYYKDGVDPGDNHSMYQGADVDIIRWGGADFQPLADQEKQDVFENFGSAHPSSFNMVFCGGAVKPISYDIDLEVHGRLANRRDGETVPGAIGSN